MKHFDYVDWLFYKEKLIVEEKEIEMEEHLYSCNKCLEIFLSIIDEEEIEDTASVIPEDFTENLISEISKKKIKTIERKSKGKFINFGYYVAVASVTIILTTTGIFNNIVDIVPKVSVGLEANNNIEKTNLIYEYSERIVDKTSEFINDIEDVEKRETRRNKK